MSDPNSPDGREHEPDAGLRSLERQGLEALDAGDFERAARLLLDVVKGYEKTGNALLTNSAGYYLGVAFAGQGKEDRAARIWEEIISRGWDSPAAFNQLVRYYEARNRPDEVQRLFERLGRAAHERTGEFFTFPATGWQESPGGQPHAGEIGRVLVADDEPSVGDVIKRALAHEGFTVFLATTGIDALRRVLNTRLDAIVLDHIMPGYTGLDVLYRLRGAGIKTPVLMISGHHEPQVMQDAGRLGATWLAKPFDQEAVVEFVRQAM